MAISATGQTLAQRNRDNRKQFEQAQATSTVVPVPVPTITPKPTTTTLGQSLTDTPSVSPTIAVDSRFNKQNFLASAGAKTTPTPLGTTNTSAGLNVGGGAPNPLSIIQPGNTTGELPNTTITQTSGQTGANSPFASGNGTTVKPTTPTSTVGGDVATSIQDGIKQNQVAIKEEEAQMDKVKAANDAAIINKSSTTDAQVLAENAYAQGMLNVDNQRMSDLNLSNTEYESEQERQKNQTLTTVQPLIDKERAYNASLLEDARVKAENAETMVAINNEVAIAQQNMAYASMGMTFTPSAINATRRLSTEASMGIAKLKSGNAFEYAGLAKEMSKTEVAHQLMVNKIIADANTNILTKRETTRKDITDIQSNILLTEKEKVQKISKLKDDYAAFRSNTEALTLTQVRDSNKEVERRLNDITTKLDKDKVDAKQELVSLIKNGQWDKLSPINKNKIAKRSGLSLGEIEGEKTSSLYTTVNAGIQALIGKDFVVTPESSKKVYDLASSYIAMGDSVFVATQKAIKALAPSLKEFTESQTYQRDLRKANIDKEAMALQVAEQQIKASEENIRSSQYNSAMQNRTISLAEAKQKAEVAKAEQDAKNPWTTSGAVNENGQILFYNKDTGDIEYRQPELVKTPQQWSTTKGTDLLYAPDGIKRPGREQCGAFANDLSGRIIGDDGEDLSNKELIAEREEVFTEETPKIGGQVFFTGKGYDAKYGHVAVVTDISPDGKTLTIKESNYGGSEKVGTRQISIDDKGISGYTSKTKLAREAEAKGVTDSLNNMKFTGDPKLVSSRLLNEMGVTNLDTITANAVVDTVTQAQKQKLSIEQTKNLVKENIKNTGFLSPIKANADEWGKVKDNDVEGRENFFRTISTQAGNVPRENLKAELLTLTYSDKEEKKRLTSKDETNSFKLASKNAEIDRYNKEVAEKGGKRMFANSKEEAESGQYYLEDDGAGGFEIMKMIKNDNDWFTWDEEVELVTAIPPIVKK